MTRILKLTIALIIAITPIAGVIYANTLADPNDQFNVEFPRPNERITGNYNVIWKMYDDDAATIPYSIDLFDTDSCSNIRYATIASGNGTSSNLQNNSYQWNSTQVSDGEYCFRVCISPLNGENRYSACNARKVFVVNSNSAPMFTSFPNNTTINEGQNYNFDVNASDPDGDNLTYRLIAAPSFLKINSGNGNISTSATPTVPTGNTQVSYKVIIGVDDGLNATTQREFILTVKKEEAVEPTPSPTPGDDPAQPPIDDDEPRDDEPQDDDPDSPIDIIIEFPEENSRGLFPTQTELRKL
jgi:hypothetical protein